MFRINYSIILLLLLTGLFTLAFASYKMKKTQVSLVPNEKSGVVYLFQLDRTDTTPTYAPLNSKVEAWLKWSGIPFHRLSNQFLLGSTEGTTPFARYNGKYYNTSDEIIEEIGKATGKYTEDPKEKELRKLIDDKLFKIVVLERVAKNGEKSGLDWMVNDDGIAEQFLPILLNKQEFTVNVVLDNTEYKMKLNAASYEAYFNAWTYLDEDSNPDSYSPNGVCEGDGEHIDGCKKAKTEFMEKFLTKVTGEEVVKEEPAAETVSMGKEKGTVTGQKKERKSNKKVIKRPMFTLKHWDEFNTQFRQKWVQGMLTIAFRDKTDGRPNLEKKLNEFLANNNLDENPDEVQTKQTYASLKDNGVAIFELLQRTLEPIFQQFREGRKSYSTDKVKDNKSLLQSYKKKPIFLFGEQPTAADASLFSMLVLFFDMPLTIPELRAYFKPEKGARMDERAEMLRVYLKHCKVSLGMNDEVWKQMTRKPWPLNFERVRFHPKMETAKYDGPFPMRTDDDLNNFLQIPEAAAAMHAIKAYTQRHEIKQKKQNAMLEVMAAYLCNLDPGKAIDDKRAAETCAKDHMRKAKTFVDEAQIEKARELAYNAIVTYNEQLVKEAVLKELDVGRNQNNESAPELGNEL